MRLSRGSRWFLAFSLLIVAAGAAGIWWLDANLFEDDFESGVAVEYEVSRGQTVRSVGEDLAELNVIRSSVRFRLSADEQDLASTLQPGRFEFLTGMEIQEAIDVLAAGPLAPPQVRFTIVEGLTIDQTLQRLAEQFDDHEVDDFRRVLDERVEAGANRPGTLQLPDLVPEPAELIGDDEDSAIEPFEGLLFPETYDVLDDASPLEILQRMIDQLAIVLNDITQELQVLEPPVSDEGEADGQAEATVDLSFYDRLVLASLIERETRVDDERRTIAGVITNRLNEGMRLQIDATVVYAMGGGPTQTVLLEDLEIEHPHNTYRIDGLPPTPIAGAGAASLRAAFDPAEVPYLFYVLDAACDGSHVFAETAEGHVDNVEAFREAGRCQ